MGRFSKGVTIHPYPCASCRKKTSWKSAMKKNVRERTGRLQTALRRFQRRIIPKKRLASTTGERNKLYSCTAPQLGIPTEAKRSSVCGSAKNAFTVYHRALDPSVKRSKGISRGKKRRKLTTATNLLAPVSSAQMPHARARFIRNMHRI